MGVQAIRALSVTKATAPTITTPASAAAAFPAAGSVSVITMLGAGDLHRLGEIQRSIKNCINHLRDYNLNDDSASDLFVAVKLDEPKASIRSGTNIALIVTGDVGIALDVTQLQNQSISIDAALQQVLDWMNEQDRLAA
jgi:hypothetical protein